MLEEIFPAVRIDIWTIKLNNGLELVAEVSESACNTVSLADHRATLLVPIVGPEHIKEAGFDHLPFSGLLGRHQLTG